MFPVHHRRNADQLVAVRQSVSKTYEGRKFVTVMAKEWRRIYAPMTAQ
jgi:hypothetical protein